MPSSKARSSARLARGGGRAVLGLGILGLAVLAALTACSTDAPPAPSPAASSASALRAPIQKPALVELTDETRASVTDGAAYVRAQRSKVEAEGKATGEARTVVVYVGAPWCEPCRRFHDALVRGDLDAQLPGFVFLELDHDKDEAMLQAMGCTSKLIPLFAVPDAQGQCSAQRSEGGIKGDGAVAFMTPKIRALATY